MAVAFDRERNRMRGLGLVEDRALAVRRDLVDDALVAGRGEDIARLVYREAPDVLVWRIEQDRRFARGVELVDFPVRRRGGVNTAAGRQRQCVDLELLGVEEHATLAG